jgi:hypothetical protein
MRLGWRGVAAEEGSRSGCDLVSAAASSGASDDAAARAFRALALAEYEEVYLHACMRTAIWSKRAGIGRHFDYYNHEHDH